jgi:hypothetical protein
MATLGVLFAAEGEYVRVAKIWNSLSDVYQHIE